MKYVIKKGGHSEKYDERKLYASIYSACLMVHTPPATATLIATDTIKRITEWLAPKHEVTTTDLRHRAAEALESYDPEAAYIFKHQRNLGR